MDSLHQMPEIFLVLRLARASISIGPDISDELRSLEKGHIIVFENFSCSLKRRMLGYFRRAQKQIK